MKINNICKVFFVLNLFFILNQTKAQTWTSFFNPTYVKSIVFDNQGNQWIGTTYGLVKFDGSKYTSYDWTNGLSDNTINSIAVDNQGKIWVGTRNGVSMYNGSNWVKFFTTDGLANNYVSSVAIDTNGDKWFGTLCGLTKYNGSNWTTYKTNNGLVNDTINFIKIDNDGNKWIATRNGVSRLSGNNFVNYQMKNGNPIFTDRSVLTIGIDNDNKLYFGTNHCILSFDGINWHTLINNTCTYDPCVFNSSLLDTKGRIWFTSGTAFICFIDGYAYTSYGGAQGRGECCTINQNGDLWFGGASGLVKYDQINWTTIKIPSLFETYNSSLKLLLCDSENNLWFTGSKLYKYTGYEWEVLNYPNSLINLGNSTKIYEDQQKNIWFGGTYGLIKYNGNNFVLYNTTNGLPNNSVVDINSDLQGNIWIATASSGIAKFIGSNFSIYNTSNSGLASNSVNNIIIDEQNNKWFTTSGNGVIKYNGSTWTTYKTPTGTGNNYFNKVLIDTTGEKWFIRSGVGIARYNEISWTEYTTADGLISNSINGIFFDKQHNIWAYSNSGVSKFNGSTWTSYTTANGLANNYINSGIADNDGNIWFNSSYNGLSKYDGNNWTIFSINNNYYNFNVYDVINDKEGNLWYSGGGVFRYSKCNLSANNILISGQTDLCKGLTNVTYSIPAILNATQYEWELPDGVVGNSNTNSITVNISQNAVSGKIYVRGKNSCGSSTRVSKQIIVNGTIPAVPDSIIGKKYVCKPDTITYMVPPVSGATSYIWTLPQGAAGNSTTNSIKVIFSNNAQSGVISVKAENNCGIGSPVSSNINITGVYPAAAGNISGNAHFCTSQNIQIYSVSIIPNADTIIWTLPYGVPSTISNNTVTLNFNPNNFYNRSISVYGRNSCGNGVSSELNIIGHNNFNGSLGEISGNRMICSGQSTDLYCVGNSQNINIQTYHWGFPSGVSTSGNNYIISANYSSTAVSGNISLYGSNPCGISQTSVLPIIISNILPSNAGLISGNTNVAKGQSNIIYSVPPIANAVEYVWTLPSGATGSSTTNSISISYSSSAISGNISVCGKNGCGQGVSSNLLISVNGTVPTAPNYISGSNKVCKGQSGVTYYTNTIANATSYQWTLPNGITGSSITNSITVNVGQNAVNGQIKVRGLNSYGAGDSAVFGITVNSPLTSPPSVISGPDTLALGQSQIQFSVINDTNVNNYIWTVPQGMTIGYPNAGNVFISVSSSAVAGNISVNGENACGTSAASVKPVIIGGSVPVATGGITGLTQACQGQSNLVYTIQPMANATSYVWTKPDGTKDTTINNYINLSLNNINYYPNLSVYGRNKFGNSSVLNLQINIKTPVSFSSNIITGYDTVYRTQCNATFGVSLNNYTNGDIFTWNYSGNGATILPYTIGDLIRINFSSTATSGILSMFVTNSCGQSITLTKQITVMQPIDYVESCNTISNINNYNSIDWGDFNNDGYLDFIYCGINAYSTKIFKNLGNGNFIELNTPNIPNVSKGTAKWGDYNNDGFIDFILLGSAGSNNYIAKIYKNNGNETFTEQNNLILPTINPYFSSGSSWADYNNDGFLDLLITGVLSPSTVMFSKIFKNNGDNTFTEQTNINLLGFSDASTAWGDFNNDSYLDLLMTGYSDLVYGNYATRLYKNDKNGNFIEVSNSNLMPAHGANAVWGDYDNDGKIDILISGDTINSGNNQPYTFIRVYKNSGNNSFIWQNQIIIDPFNWSGGVGYKEFNAVWGDYNNDGLLDIITSGDPVNLNYDNFVVYKNNGNNTFSKHIVKNLNSSDEAMVSIADIDNDGDLDALQNYLLYKSYINTSTEYGLSFYNNKSTTINTLPIPPANLTSAPNNNQVLLKWNRGSDAETPQKGLTYNIRVGTYPGGSDIMNPMANPVTGKRTIVENGNTSQDTTWILKNLLPGTYYWAVQTIDNAYNGSVFSQENSFTLCSNPILSVSSISGQSNICAGQSNIKYKVVALANATSYIWSLPYGSIGNSNSDSIIVSFTNNAQSGNITVKGFNNCGNSDSIVYPVKVFNSLPAKPLAISGNSSVCEGNDSVFFSTPFQSDATSYIWLSSFAGPVINSPNYTYVNINSNNQNNYIAVKAENVCGISDSLIKPIIIKTKPMQPSSISGIQDLCLGQSNVNYSILPISNAIFYQWTLPNAITGNSITNNINVNAVSNLASGNISVKGMNSCGEGIQSSINLVVNSDLPNITDSISGPVNIIAGQQNVVYTCSSINNASSYIWTLPDGSIDTTSTNSINYSFQVNAQTANISVKGLNACGVGSSKSLTVNIVNLMPVSADTILGSNNVCQGYNNVIYTVPPITNASFYIWTLPNGTFGSSTTNSISVNFGANSQSGIISVKGRNLIGDGDSAVLFVTVNQLPPQPSDITGDTVVCQGQSNVKYKINPIQNTTSYVWTLPNGVSGNSTSDSILLNFSVSAQAGLISVKGQNSCGTGSAKAQLININQLPANAATISGLSNVCQGQNSVIYSIPSILKASSYNWILPAGVNGNSDSNTIILNIGNSAVSGNIIVKGINSCGFGNSSAKSINVQNAVPSTPLTITGSAAVCVNQNNITYSVNAINNANSYQWSLPSGSIGNSSTNSITVSYGANAISGNISVRGINSCGLGQESIKAITVGNIPVTAGNISGAITVCQGQTNVIYTVPAISNATSYTWTLPSGASGSSSTNSINVSFNSTAVSGNVTVKGVNSCGSGTSSSLSVIVNSIPSLAGNIVGLNTICNNQNNVIYQVSNILNAVSYIWTLPTGASGNSSSNSINVNFSNYTQTGVITVKGQNTCGTGQSSSITINSSQPPGNTGVINGNSTVCQGQTNLIYFVSGISNATSYVWTLPYGVSGYSTSTNLNATFGLNSQSGNISVYGQNSCGVSQTINFPVIVNSLPNAASAINGANQICQGEINVPYSVAPILNANSYIWTLPQGANGNSNTNTIYVNFPNNSQSGNISVKGINSCGDGPNSTLAVNIKPTPQTPVITQINDTLFSNVPFGNQWFNLLTGLINNATSQTFHPLLIGNYFTIVIQNGCKSDTSNVIYFNNIGINHNTLLSNYIKIYPNPAKENLIIELIESHISQKTIISIYNIQGQMCRQIISNQSKTEVDIKDLSTGLYVVKLNNEKESFVSRFVKE